MRRGLFQLCVAAAALWGGSAAAGPNLAPRDFDAVYSRPLTIGDTDWSIWGRVAGLGPNCMAYQEEDYGARSFDVGRYVSGKQPGKMFLILHNPSWAPPLSEPMMKIEVKWASWRDGGVLRVGILDAVIYSNSIMVMLGIPQDDIDSLIGSANRVEFAVPDRVVRPGGEPKMWVKGFGRQLAPALKRCTDAIERFLPQPVVDRTEKGDKHRSAASSGGRM